MDINALDIQKNKIEQFKKKGINTIEDLLNFLLLYIFLNL